MINSSVEFFEETDVLKTSLIPSVLTFDVYLKLAPATSPQGPSNSILVSSKAVISNKMTVSTKPPMSEGQMRGITLTMRPGHVTFLCGTFIYSLRCLL